MTGLDGIVYYISLLKYKYKRVFSIKKDISRLKINAFFLHEFYITLKEEEKIIL